MAEGDNRAEFRFGKCERGGMIWVVGNAVGKNAVCEGDSDCESLWIM